MKQLTQQDAESTKHRINSPSATIYMQTQIGIRILLKTVSDTSQKDGKLKSNS